MSFSTTQFLFLFICLSVTFFSSCFAEIQVSFQAFNDDLQGRRTLGLFIHRWKADITDSFRKVHMFVDSREKVTAQYQREVMVFGSLKETGTLLLKAPKGWGWRTALLFHELTDLLQNGTLRVADAVQLI